MPLPPPKVDFFNLSSSGEHQMQGRGDTYLLRYHQHLELAHGRCFTFTFHFPALEKETAAHSSVLAWRIPRTGEPGGLPSMGLHRVGCD